MKNKAVWMVIGVVVLASVGLVTYLLQGRASTTPMTMAASPFETQVEPATADVLTEMGKVLGARKRTTRTGDGKTARPRRKGPGQEKSMFDDLPEAERKFCEDIQAALDDEDLERTLAAASRAMNCENPEVRAHVVDALGWFGADALPELTIMMGDKDEEVARSAIDAWESGLSEIDDAKLRLNVSGMALRAVDGNKDASESISHQFSIAATEFIDAEDDETAASVARVKVIQTVADMIASQNENLSAAGYALYEDITGNEWRGSDEAERYLKDPDNYELPEDREPESRDREAAAE